MIRRIASAGGVLAMMCALVVPSGQALAEDSGKAAGRHDVITWGAGADRLGEGVAGRGYRLVVHTSAGGDNLRIRLSNAFGDRPVTFD
ncbi:SGNH/GDSL hydrolase family protein, partial [Streptomyces sp. 2MCAF27]